MFQTMIMIDDFYEDPLKLREVALGTTYPEPDPGAYYPGKNSKNFVLPPNTNEMFSFILREKVAGMRDQAHGHFRYSLASSQRPAEVHIDPGASWAGVISLTLDKDCQGGTEFFPHKRFGTHGAPLTDQEAKKIYGIKTRREVVRQIIYDDGHHLDRWDHVMTLPMRFNRCVLFRPWLWHTSGVDFGDTMENGRLVQLLFFESVEAKGAMSAPPALTS